MLRFSQSDTEMEDDFSFLQPLDLITKDVYELRKIIKEKKENLQQDKQREIDKDSNEPDREHEREHAQAKEKEKQQKEKEREQDRGRVEKHKEQKGIGKEKPHEAPIDSKQGGDKVIVRHEENGHNGGNLCKFFNFLNVVEEIYLHEFILKNM